MKYLLIILLLVSTLFADTEIFDWLVPIRIFYQDGKVEKVWTFYESDQMFNLETEMPVSGKNILFVNKIGSDTLWVSDSLYRMADGFPVLFFERVVLLKKVAMVKIIYSDSLYPIGIFSDRVLRDKTAKIAKTKVPLEYDKIDSGIEDYFLYYHIYIYDHNWSVKRVWDILKSDAHSKELEEAKKLGQIIVIEEAAP